MFRRHMTTRMKKYFFCNTFTAGGAAIFQTPAYKKIGTGIRRSDSRRSKKKGGAAYLERKLKALFDFQKYEENADLQKVIDRVHARYNSRAQLLHDDDVEFVNAAGVQDTGMKEKSLLNKKDDNS